ncbi:LamG-like jellyroll fold domain-containing protein [Patescibacteria group bacterium]
MSNQKGNHPAGHIPHTDRPPLKPKRRIKLPSFLTKSRNVVGVVLVLVFTAAAIVFALFGADIATFLADLGDTQTITVTGADFLENENEDTFKDAFYDEESSGVRLKDDEITGHYVSKVFDASSPVLWNKMRVSTESVGSADSALEESLPLVDLPAATLQLALDEEAAPFLDQSDNGHNMTCESCPTTTTDAISGSALSFDGTNSLDFISQPYDYYWPDRDNRTYSFWVKPGDFQQDASILTIRDKYQYWWYFKIMAHTSDAYNIEKGITVFHNIGWQNAKYNSHSNVLSENEFTHVAVTVDSSKPWSDPTKISIFINGEDQTNRGAHSVIGNPSQLAIKSTNLGGSYNNRMFKGLIDNFRMYDAVLSPDAVQGVYQTDLSGPPSEPPTGGLAPILHIPFDEDSFALSHVDNQGKEIYTVAEVAGNNLNAFCKIGGEDNCPTAGKMGKFGGAAEFVGSARDYVQVEHSDALNMTSDFTVAAWLNFSNLTQDFQTLFHKKAGVFNSDQGWYAEFANNRVGSTTTDMFRLLGSEGRSGSSAKTKLKENEWHHVAATVADVEGTMMVTWFIDGEQSGRSLNIKPINTNSIPLTIGSFFDQYSQFNGLMDEVRIYGSVLSRQHIRALRDENTDDIPDNSEVIVQARWCKDLSCNVSGDWTPCNSEEGEQCDIDIQDRQFFQYRVIFDSTDVGLSELLTKVEIDYVDVPSCFYSDVDGDGVNACDDCDDNDPNKKPGLDNDGDGFDSCEDCDDNNGEINPSVIEICGDGIDNACYGEPDKYCYLEEDLESNELYAVKLIHRNDGEQETLELAPQEDNPVSIVDFGQVTNGIRSEGRYALVAYDESEKVLDAVFFAPQEERSLIVPNGASILQPVDQTEQRLVAFMPKPPAGDSKEIKRLEIRDLEDAEFSLDVVTAEAQSLKLGVRQANAITNYFEDISSVFCWVDDFFCSSNTGPCPESLQVDENNHFGIKICTSVDLSEEKANSMYDAVSKVYDGMRERKGESDYVSEVYFNSLSHLVVSSQNAIEHMCGDCSAGCATRSDKMIVVSDSLFDSQGLIGLLMTHELAHQFEYLNLSLFIIRKERPELWKNYPELVPLSFKSVRELAEVTKYINRRQTTLNLYCKFTPGSVRNRDQASQDGDDFIGEWIEEYLKRKDPKDYLVLKENPEDKCDYTTLFRWKDEVNPATREEDPFRERPGAVPQSAGTTRTYSASSFSEALTGLYESLYMEEFDLSLPHRIAPRRLDDIFKVHKPGSQDCSKVDSICNTTGLGAYVRIFGLHCLIEDNDHDGVPDEADNCNPSVVEPCKDTPDRCNNPKQLDENGFEDGSEIGNGEGDVCELCPDPNNHRCKSGQCCEPGFYCLEDGGCGPCPKAEQNPCGDECCGPNQTCLGDKHGPRYCVTDRCGFGDLRYHTNCGSPEGEQVCCPHSSGVPVNIPCAPNEAPQCNPCGPEKELCDNGKGAKACCTQCRPDLCPAGFYD